LGWGTFPAACMLVGLMFLPESPRWLLYNKQDTERALAALVWMRSSRAAAEAELTQISAAIAIEHQSRPIENGHPTLMQRLVKPRVFRALCLGVGLQLLQQSIGINTIMYYSATILQMSHGASEGCPSADVVKDRLTSSDVRDVCWTVPIASCQLVGNFVGMALADRSGRRPLTLSSLSLVCLSLVALGYSFYPQEAVGSLALGGMCIYLLAFGIGMSPMPWVVNAEIYPLDERSVANSIATAANWVGNFIVSFTFLDLASALSTSRDCPSQHPDGAFWLYAAIALVGLIVLAFKMPETSGKSLEEMDEIFETSGRHITSG